MGSGTPIVDLENVTVTIDAKTILNPLDWTIERDQHWAILGPNGGGKSTLVRVAALGQHPSSGTVRVLGHELGRVDIRSLRSRIGVTSAGLVDQLRASLTCGEVVVCGLTGALEPWWHTYSAEDRAKATQRLTDVGMDSYVERRLGTLSSGERQRVLLARALVSDPELIILDEPTAGLDFGGRESLIATLDAIAESPAAPATVFVTHHVEDIPSSTTHLLGIAEGRVAAKGTIGTELTGELLSKMFELNVALSSVDGRWSARVVST